ncbi:hypothetical protein AOQ84DRAFT_376790 [Glonium stellatum]|uniref:Uncharacterized protein n=1 Tax=Glonium stellatum TaxID=574774 RepID=A0A8E2F0Q9_9PEZI|nr:hypothetical protein AOQ84DRAFT_376790 [Glonium stellatum]
MSLQCWRGKKRAYDESSGQVYEESTASVRSMIPHWLTRSRGRIYRPGEYKSPGPGVASLRDIAIRSAILHIDIIPPEVLKCVPWVVGKTIADYLTRTEAWSLKIWGTFAAAYSGEEDPVLKQYKINLCTKASGDMHELDLILKQLSTLSFNHITNLSIHRLKFTKTDFITLSNIQNLGVLALSCDHSVADADHSGDIDDTFMKKWSRLVGEESRLLKLKVFILRRFTLTAYILNYFSALPALLLCNIENRTLDQKLAGGITLQWGWDLLYRVESNWDPEEIWHDQEMSTHALLRECYKYAIIHTLRAPGEPQPAMPKSPVLSIDYGASCSQIIVGKPQSIWYKRISLAQSIVAAKRAVPTPQKSQDHAKRTRSIRPGKQIDLGDFLGSF